MQKSFSIQPTKFQDRKPNVSEHKYAVMPNLVRLCGFHVSQCLHILEGKGFCYIADNVTYVNANRHETGLQCCFFFSRIAAAHVHYIHVHVKMKQNKLAILITVIQQNLFNLILKNICGRPNSMPKRNDDICLDLVFTQKKRHSNDVVHSEVYAKLSMRSSHFDGWFKVTESTVQIIF